MRRTRRGLRFWRSLPCPAAIVGLVLAGLAAPALGQATSTNIAPPPERFAVAPGGVDMRSGRYAYSQTDLSIGGEDGLALTRSLAQPVAGHANPFANFSHNWEIMLSEKQIDLAHGDFTHSAGHADYVSH